MMTIAKNKNKILPSLALLLLLAILQFESNNHVGCCQADAFQPQISVPATSARASRSSSSSLQAVREANPSKLSKLQGPLQDALAPGHWLGRFLNLNSRAVTWEFSNKNAQQVSTAIKDVFENLSQDQREKLFIPEFTIVEADAQKGVHIRAWTKKEWLDAFDVKFVSSNNGKGCTAKTKFYATGFLPTSIPGAPIINVGLAFFPFVSPGPNGKLLQDFRLEKLEELIRSRLNSL